ncbi:MAG: transposase [Proteobacteria bacterium]|nr:transposase [Pseudomonadota bacterium]MBU1059853.1 transposase [Pseudomonadota bacterium]
MEGDGCCLQGLLGHCCRCRELGCPLGLEHRDLDNITVIGVDEIQYHNGQNYLTLVYQIDKHCRRLLWIGKE